MCMQVHTCMSMMMRAVFCGVQLPSHGQAYGSAWTGGSTAMLTV